MTTKPNTQAIREKLDKELGSYKIDGKEFREMWGLFDLVVVFLDEQLSKKEEEVRERLYMATIDALDEWWIPPYEIERIMDYIIKYSRKPNPKNE